MIRKKKFFQRKRHAWHLRLLKAWDKGGKGNVKQRLKINRIEILNLSSVLLFENSCLIFLHTTTHK